MGGLALRSRGEKSGLSLQECLGISAVLLLALVMVLPDWHRGIYILFGWLVLEDLIRRALPGQPIQVQLVKEILLLVLYVAFFVSWRKKGGTLWTPPFVASLLGFSAVVFVDSLNPSLPSFLVPMLGIRSYLWYLPLLWIGFYAFKTKRDAIRFSRGMMSLAIPLGVLGVTQYILWEQLPLWLQPLEGAHAFHSAAFEYGGTILDYESKLPSSVFGSAHRFAMFSLFLFFLGIGVWGSSPGPSKGRGRSFTGFCIFAALVCIVTAGTRMGMGLVVGGLLLLVVQPVLTARRGFFRKRARLRQILVGLILCAAFFVVLQVFPDTGRFFVYTTEGDVKTHWSQFTRGELPLVLKKAAWMGFGTGSLSQGLNYVAGGAEAFDFASRESEGVGVEYGLAKVTWELGVLGLAAFLFSWGHIFLSIWRNLRALRDAEMKGLAQSLGMLSLLVFIAFLKGHYYFGDGTTLVFYWFGMGLFFSFRRIERLGRRLASRAACLPR